MRRLIEATFSPSRVHCQPPVQPANRQPSRCSQFTSIARQASTVSRPDPLGRPDPTNWMRAHERSDAASRAASAGVSPGLLRGGPSKAC